MAISDAEKLDFLWKKVIFGTSKTASAANKSGSNETIASPLPVYAGNVWTQAGPGDIPTSPPGSSTSVITRYYGAQRLQMTMDPTSPVNQSWTAGQTNLIPTTFGSGYLVRVWLGDPNGAKAARIFPDTTNQEYVFDYVSGVLNFTGTIPTGISATIGSGTVSVAVDGVYLEVYQYVGTTLDTSMSEMGGAKSTVAADIAARDAIVDMNAGDIVYVVDASGDPSAAGPGEYATYLWTGSSWQVIATQASARTDALTSSVTITFDDFASPNFLIGNVGNGTRVVEVSIEVTDAFDDDAEITIGDASDNARLVNYEEVDLTVEGVYLINPVYQFPSGGNVDVSVFFFNGTPTQGEAKVTITWA